MAGFGRPYRALFRFWLFPRVANAAFRGGLHPGLFSQHHYGMLSFALGKKAWTRRSTLQPAGRPALQSHTLRVGDTDGELLRKRSLENRPKPLAADDVEQGEGWAFGLLGAALQLRDVAGAQVESVGKTAWLMLARSRRLRISSLWVFSRVGHCCAVIAG